MYLSSLNKLIYTLFIFDNDVLYIYIYDCARVCMMYASRCVYCFVPISSLFMMAIFCRSFNLVLMLPYYYASRHI